MHGGSVTQYIFDCDGVTIGATAKNATDAVSLAQRAFDSVSDCECFQGANVPSGTSIIGWNPRKYTVTEADIKIKAEEP